MKIDNKYNTRLEMTKGDTVAWAVKFTNITEDLRSAYFTIKENPDSAPVLQKTLNAGITKISDREYKQQKTYKIQLQAIDTLNLTAGLQYLYDFKVEVGSVVKTIMAGIFIAQESITNPLDLILDEATVEPITYFDYDIETTPATNGVEYEQDPIAMQAIGDLDDLETTDKTDIVEAINEVNDIATNAKDDIGDISQLDTTDKSDLVNAINEVKGTADDATTNIGDLTQLNTTDKSNLVNAINEVNTKGTYIKKQTYTNAITSIFYNYIMANLDNIDRIVITPRSTQTITTRRMQLSPTTAGETLTGQFTAQGVASDKACTITGTQITNGAFFSDLGTEQLDVLYTTNKITLYPQFKSTGTGNEITFKGGNNTDGKFILNITISEYVDLIFNGEIQVEYNSGWGIYCYAPARIMHNQYNDATACGFDIDIYSRA